MRTKIDSGSDRGSVEAGWRGRRRRLGALMVAVVAVSACDDSTGLDGLDDAVVLDAAMLAADETIEEYTLWSQPLSFSSSAPSLAHGIPGGHHGFDGEFSGVHSVTFFDAAGVEQTAYDPSTTDSIHILHAVEGTITRGTFTASISRERDMTVSGLEGEETTRTWNGSGSSEMARSGTLDDGTERSHSVSGAFTYDDVVVPVPGSDSPWPLSGTITRTMTAIWTTADGTQTREIDVVITFDGTATAVAVVNGETIEIDLSAQDGHRPFRRRG